MRIRLFVLFFLSAWPAIGATRIDDPRKFVADVYKHFMTVDLYNPPEDFYTPRLDRIVKSEHKRSGGEVGCIDFDFWVNGQDFEIKGLEVTDGSKTPDRQTVIAKFNNLGSAEEIHFEFQRIAGRWLLDEVQSVKGMRWILSKLLSCKL
jgi:hypothetical protein